MAKEREPVIECGGGPCEAHSLMERVVSENRADTKELREMFAKFMMHAAEEHTKIREEILLMTKACTEANARHHNKPDQPHPFTRAEDREDKIALTLSRRDFWRMLIVIIFVFLMTVGIALVAGREGLVIWKPMTEHAAKGVTGAP